MKGGGAMSISYNSEVFSYGDIKHRTGVYCKTRSEARDVLVALNELGYKWSDGRSALEFDAWDGYSNKLGISYVVYDKDPFYDNRLRTIRCGRGQHQECVDAADFLFCYYNSDQCARFAVASDEELLSLLGISVSA